MGPNIPNPPLIFANRVIRRLIDNLFGDDLIATKEDYLTMRTVFRHKGGLWDRIMVGDVRHINMLLRIVTFWGKMPTRRREVDEAYDD